jgi:hypothetical protein
MIDPTGRERATPGDPPGRQGRSPDGTVQPDGLRRVTRAARVEPALSAQPAGEQQPVQADQSQQQRARGSARSPGDAPDPGHDAITPARVSNPSTSGTSSCVRAAPIVLRATSAMSNPSRTLGASSRHTARSTRRTRLRTTAPPTRLPATNATAPEPGATNTTTRSPCTGWPDVRSRATSVLLVGSSGRQAGPALGPAPGQDRAPGPGTHPDPEAVPFRPSADVGLIGSFGHRFPAWRARRWSDMGHGRPDRQSIAGPVPTGSDRFRPVPTGSDGESAPKGPCRGATPETAVL